MKSRASANPFHGRASLRSRAVTFGPIFSSEIAAGLDKLEPAKPPTFELLEAVVAEARAKGANVDRWLDARFIISVFGAAAEPRLSNRDFEDV